MNCVEALQKMNNKKHSQNGFPVKPSGMTTGCFVFAKYTPACVICFFFMTLMLILSFAPVVSMSAEKDAKTAKEPQKTAAKEAAKAPAKETPKATAAPVLKSLSDKHRPVFRALSRWLEDAPHPETKSKARENKLRTIDNAMLLEDAKKLACVGEFYQSRMKELVYALSRSKPGDDTIVWKLYNHGAIIQTKDISIAVDLVMGYDQLELRSETLKLLVEHIDVLLITSKTAGHADSRVADMFVEAGRPVVAPEIFWSKYKKENRLTVIREGILEYPGAVVKVYPGQAGATPNNVYLVRTASGRTIVHTGDNKADAGKEWFRKFKKPISVDGIITDITSEDAQALFKLVRPAAVIPAHEHELWRQPSERLTYGKIQSALKTLKVPYYLPAWGESVTIPSAPDSSRQQN